MDYVLGSVAALVSGNVTPNRPKLRKRALTPTKHQPSPNVTPKSELVEDRSVFLSPTLQKKKAIVKKSPKRIFQNPDLETTDSNDGNSSLTSPKAEKVKKHLKDDLDSESNPNKGLISPKTPKTKLNNSKQTHSSQENSINTSDQSNTENTPKKKKMKCNSLSIVEENSNNDQAINVSVSNIPKMSKKSPNRLIQRRKSMADTEINDDNTNTNIKMPTENKGTVTESDSTKKKKNKKRNKKNQANKTTEAVNDVKKVDIEANMDSTETTNDISKTNPQTNNETPKKKKKRRNKKNKNGNKEVSTKDATEPADKEGTQIDNITLKNKYPKQKEKEAKEKEAPKQKNDNDDQSDDDDMEQSTESGEVNPNAITNQDSDSEHDSDDEIESENEEINKSVLDSAAAEDSSDEEEEKPEKVEKKPKETVERDTEDEIKRTVFVGNVPFSTKCKKEIKKIFSKHGQIETIRIRTVPIKDGRFTPKLAVIKNELHPERSTVNVYIKYADASSVEQALTENNTVLNEHHLRVSRSDSTGAEHDPRCSVFVGNLPFALEDDALRTKFQGCGDIRTVRIVRDRKTNAGKGFGYVNFVSKDGVELALAMSEEDLTIKNRILRVKRCTQMPDKQKQTNKVQQKGFQTNNRFQGQNNRHQGQGNRSEVQGNRPQGEGNRFQNQGNNRLEGQMGNRGGFQGQGRFQNQEDGNRGRFQGQGNRGRFQGQGNQGRFQGQGNQGQFQRQGNQGKFQGQEKENDGAFRRIMNKRQNQESGDGPPNKKQKNINQPGKEKKVRKEFVGMTAEKKKKHKFDKGQKKKKALSEILTK